MPNFIVVRKDREGVFAFLIKIQKEKLNYYFGVVISLTERENGLYYGLEIYYW